MNMLEINSQTVPSKNLTTKNPALSNWTTKEVSMFKHILLPTDGSELSEAAIQKGVQFAKDINAEVTGFHVILPFHVFSLRMGILEDTKEQYERQSKGQAEQFLGVIKRRRKRRA